MLLFGYLLSSWAVATVVLGYAFLVLPLVFFSGSKVSKVSATKVVFIPSSTKGSIYCSAIKNSHSASLLNIILIYLVLYINVSKSFSLVKWFLNINDIKKNQQNFHQTISNFMLLDETYLINLHCFRLHTTIKTHKLLLLITCYYYCAFKLI